MLEKPEKKLQFKQEPCNGIMSNYKYFKSYNFEKSEAQGTSRKEVDFAI